jgi:hypothetical protein
MKYDMNQEKERIIDILKRAEIPSAVVDALTLTADRISFMRYQLMACERTLVDDPNNAEMVRAYTNLSKVYLGYINQILAAVPDNLKDEVKESGDDVLQMVRNMHKVNRRKTS